ncbi:Ankyrin repeat domain containing protein [Asbolus verrucosus]|uniref:Ankyrin repeat domain containing protein n=1 Tax=Asbolus verrucosus TaxID=1661398 RepID=A0A482W8M6_ASBVE|nr:Ankyrin repeat domain containing protein [Asbolus verrucosus]
MTEASVKDVAIVRKTVDIACKASNCDVCFNKCNLKMTLATYKKRSGTSDRGRDYECLLCALYALRFSISDDVIDFEMSTNNEIFGDLDDLALEVRFANGATKTFLFQMKHTEKQKTLATTALISQSGDSSLFKYLKSFRCLQKNRRSLENFVLIFFTNRSADFAENLQLSLGTQQIYIKQQNCVCYNLLNTSKGQNRSIFKFETVSEENQDFFQRFYLYVNQQNDISLREAVTKTLNAQLHCDICFLEFMRGWWAGNFKLTKDDVIMKLAELVFSPMIKTLSDVKCNEKTELIKEAVLKCDLTLVGRDDDIAEIWREVQKDIKRINLVALKYGLITKGLTRMDDLSSEKQSKVLWYLNDAPLIIQFDRSKKISILLIIKLLERCTEKKKLILVEGGVKENFPNWKVFANLSDIPKVGLRKKIAKNFSCKLQGKKTISLEELGAYDSEITEVFHVSSLLQIALDDSFNIGEAPEELPPTYIPRSIPKIFISTAVLDGLKESKILLNCKGKLEVIQRVCKRQVVKITKYNPRDIYICDPKYYIYGSEDEFREKELEMAVSDTKKAHCFNVIDSKTLQWVNTNENLEELEDYRRLNTTECFDGFGVDNYLHNRIWILTSHTGGGKTTLLNHIKNQSPPNCFVIKMNLKEHDQFFRGKHKITNIEPYVMKFTATNRKYNAFEMKLLKKFERKKIILLWDGFDEIHSDSREFFIDCVKQLHSSGMTQWITSRNGFQKFLEKNFGVFAISMLPFREEEQNYYIRERSKVNDPTTMEEFFKNINIVDDSEYLGVPLQLYILTEIFNQNPEALKSILTLTDMCRDFIEGKYTHFLKKTKCDIDFFEDLIENSKEHRLEQYKIAALKTYMPDHCHTLNLKSSPRFMKEVKKGDFLGLIIKIDEDGSVTFEHNIFGEYLCALWCSQNRSQVPKDILQEKHRNIKFMFDLLLADHRPIFVKILYKKFEDLAGCEVVKDSAGRSPLHVICTYGQRHPLLTKKTSTGKYLVEADRAESVESDSEDLKFALYHLKNRCNPSERDDLFGWTPYDYADQSLSLGLIEVLGGELDSVLPSLQNYKDPTSVLYYSTKFNYPNLFTAITQIPYVEDDGGGNLLHVAAEHGRENFLISLLDRKPYLKWINKSNEHKWTPIHFASFNGNLPMLRFLREKGGTFPLREPSVLSLATTHGYQKIVEFLLELNVSPNELYHRNYFTQSLPIAISRGYIEIVKFLVRNGAKLYKIGKNAMNALHMALDNEQFEIAEFFLSKGMNIDDVDATGQTSYHFAAINNQKSVVLFLLVKNAKYLTLDKCGRNPLHLAAQHGSLEVAQILMGKGVDYKIQDKNGKTPLHLAVLYGKIEMVELLIGKGADIDSSDRYGRVPIHYAAIYGSKDSIEFLLNHGASLEIRDKLYGRTPLHYAAWKGHEDCVEVLINKGAQVDVTCNFLYTPLHLAVDDNSYDTCQLLLNYGASVSVVNRYGITPLNMVRNHNYAIYLLLLKYHPEPLHEAAFNVEIEAFLQLLDMGYDINTANENGITPLHVAVGRPNVANLLKLSIEKGANIKARNKNGFTPLHWILQGEYPNEESVEILLRADLKKETINARTDRELTPLHIASQAGCLNLYTSDSYDDVYLKLVQLLLDQGAEVCVDDDEGFTPLHYASQSGNLEIVKLLTKKSSKINKPNKHGRTPLHMAATKGSVPIVEHLLEQGASVDLEDREGDTPLDDALKAEHPQVFKILSSRLSKISNIDATNSRGRTILHVASKAGLSNLVEFFLSKNASVDIVDNDGNTPLDDALFNRRFDVFALLQQKLKLFDVNKFNKRQKRYPLHVVASCGVEELVKCFLEAGAELDVVDEDGNTPLHKAVQHRHKGAIKLLLRYDQGRTVNRTNKEGQTALHIAVKQDEEDLVEMLVRKGARIDVVDNEGDTPFDVGFHRGNIVCAEGLLNFDNFDVNKHSCQQGKTLLHYAVAENSLEFAEWLIRNGASINATDIDGYTPLHRAFKQDSQEMAQLLLKKCNRSIDFHVVDQKSQENVLQCAAQCSPALVELLLKSGASARATSQDGSTPLDCALEEENAQVFELLLEELDDDVVHMTERDGRTVLHIAAAQGCVNLARVLLRKGASINEADRSGCTPLDNAAQKGHLDILELLLEKDRNFVAVNKSDHHGRTLLHLAVEEDNLDMVELLVRKGARIELVDENGESAVEMAERNKRTKISEFFSQVD